MQKFFQTNTRFGVPLSVALVVAGCARMIVGDVPPPIRAQATVQDIAAADYMARYVLPPDQQAELLGRLSKTPPAAAPGVASPSATPTLMGMGATALLGQNPISPGGSGTALLVEGSLRLLDSFTKSSTISTDRIGSIALPAAFFNSTPKAAFEAKDVAKHYLADRTAIFAKRVGRSIDCVNDCSGNTPTYRLHRGSAPPLPYYDPEDLFVTFVYGQFTSASPDPARDAILGFEATWATQSPYDFVLCVDDVPPQKRGGAVKNCRATYQRPLERELLRTLTADGYLTYTSRWTFARISAIKGRLFALADKPTGQRLVEYEIDPATDAPFLPASAK